MYGTYEQVDGKPAVRFERRYPHSVARVWRSVTEPDELARWFPTTVDVDLREGGDMRFTFPGGEAEPMDGSVVELDPPRLFAFLWGRDLLRIELEPDGDGCRLRLTQTLGGEDEAARNAAGWHVCLDRLAGEESDWEPYYEEYRRRGLPAGAEMPGRA